jgi:hypothetical protein
MSNEKNYKYKPHKQIWVKPGSSRKEIQEKRAYSRWLHNKDAEIGDNRQENITENLLLERRLNYWDAHPDEAKIHYRKLEGDEKLSIPPDPNYRASQYDKKIMEYHTKESNKQWRFHTKDAAYWAKMQQEIDNHEKKLLKRKQEEKEQEKLYSKLLREEEEKVKSGYYLQESLWETDSSIQR